MNTTQKSILNQFVGEFRSTGQISAGRHRPMSPDEIVVYSQLVQDQFEFASNHDNRADDLDPLTQRVVQSNDGFLYSAEVDGDFRKGEFHGASYLNGASCHTLTRTDSNHIQSFWAYGHEDGVGGIAFHIPRHDLERSRIIFWSASGR